MVSISNDLSFLDLINICDNVHIRRPSPTPSGFDEETLIPWCLHSGNNGAVIGLLRPIVIDQLCRENNRSAQLGLPEVWDLRLDASTYCHRTDGGRGALTPSVSFHSWLDTPAKRTATMKEICERWRDTNIFPDVCGPRKWRDEMYPVYRDPFGVHDRPSSAKDENHMNYVFEMERSACAVFGVVTYGVHMSIYDRIIDDSGIETLRVWVPTRAKTKQTWPGFLDNTVAGGIPSGMSVFESLMKESMEEASISETIVRAHARAVGAISYFIRTSQGWLQPEIEYVYDICIPTGADLELFIPKPLDGEVECFEFLTQDQLMTRLRAGLFKPNCGLVIIDLLVRLGYITPDNEPDYMEIITRLHGRFDYTRW